MWSRPMHRHARNTSQVIRWQMAMAIIYLSNVNSIEEMTNMMSATRSYQTNVETINSVKELMLRTLSLGQ